MHVPLQGDESDELKRPSEFPPQKKILSSVRQRLFYGRKKFPAGFPALHERHCTHLVEGSHAHIPALERRHAQGMKIMTCLLFFTHAHILTRQRCSSTCKPELGTVYSVHNWGIYGVHSCSQVCHVLLGRVHGAPAKRWCCWAKWGQGVVFFFTLKSLKKDTVRRVI